MFAVSLILGRCATSSSSSALIVGAIVVTRVSGFVMRRAVRLAAASRTRLESADVSEQRRRQRTDAAARMLNHVVALVVWTAVTIVVFHLFEIDAAFFLSSAGFIGAAVAIGGQHKVNDYLTGLSVLFEDRYGVGDELVVEVMGREPIHAVVDNIGLVTTRLRDERSTLHVPNAQLVVVRNLSQEAIASTVRLHAPRRGRRRDRGRGGAQPRRDRAADRRRVRRRSGGPSHAGRHRRRRCAHRPPARRTHPFAAGGARRAGAAGLAGGRRARAARWRRITRRSSSDSPPQTPESWLVVRAKSRHSTRTVHSLHTCFARSIWVSAVPVVPTGKNSSGSVSRHRAWSRQVGSAAPRARLDARIDTDVLLRGRGTSAPTGRENYGTIVRNDKGSPDDRAW